MKIEKSRPVSGDGNAMVVNSCCATATQSSAQSLPKFQIILFLAMIVENWEMRSRKVNVDD